MPLSHANINSSFTPVEWCSLVLRALAASPSSCCTINSSTELWVIDKVDRVAKLWKMATEVQLRPDRMETDLEAEALGDSKHRGSFQSLKTHVRFAKDLGGSQGKHTMIRM